MKKSSRFTALDVLRALAIFGMGWSGMVPYKTLPAWMYHAQLPPPSRAFNDHVFGITWVDLVFPFFLFAMGASIPIAISRRLEKGDGVKTTILGVLWRGALLAAFALLGQQLRPYVISSQNVLPIPVLLLSLWGLILLVGIFVRYPDSWPKNRVICLQVASWIGALVTISLIHYPDGTGFNNQRNDIILMVLANVAVSGSLIWLWTRNRHWLRLVVFLAVLTIFLTRHLHGIGEQIWNFDPLNFLRKDHWPGYFDFDHWKMNQYVPIVYHFAYHKYLLIVLPGTFCGDLIAPLMNSSTLEPGGHEEWTQKQWLAISVLGIGLSLVAVCTLLAREVTLCGVLFVVLGIALLKLTQGPQTPTERAVQALCQWGIAFLLVGILAEPIGGGIRKDEATLSYFLITSGLAFTFLCGLIAVTGPLKVKLTLLAESGQNPIFAYIAITNAVPTVFGLTFVWQAIDQTNIDPWSRLALAFLRNIFVLYLAALLTRKRIFLRA